MISSIFHRINFASFLFALLLCKKNIKEKNFRGVMLTKQLTKIFSQPTARVKTISFHPQKPVFITGLHNGLIKAWDYQSNALMHEFNDHDGSVRTITFHPQGDFFISAGDDKIIRLWDYTRRTLSKKFKGHTDFIRALDFHPTKPWFVSSSDDQTIRIWNFMTGKCLGTATGHSHYIMAVRFLNENSLISGSLDQSLRVWSCEGLIDNTKKSTFVPSIVIKQILSGHDRGINSIFVKNNFVISGGDDREVKTWEFNGIELEEKDSFFNHQGCITSVSYNDQCVVSGGEDGQLIVYNLEMKQYEKFGVEGRFWTVAQKNNLIIGGHDSGYVIFRYDTPKILCKSIYNDIDLYFYTKDLSIFSSNLKTEKKVCEPTGVLLSMHSIENILLLQFKTHFEIHRKNKCILKEQAEGVLIKINGDINVVVREKTEFFIVNLEGNTIKTLSNAPGSLLFGGDDYFFIRRNLNVVRCTPNGEETIINLGFKVEQIICKEKGVLSSNELLSNNEQPSSNIEHSILYAFISKNDIHLYDGNLNFINGIKEVVNIHGGFFYQDVFIYATTKHIKYIFREDGVIRSIDTEIYPFHYSQGQIFYLTNEGFESIDVDLTEIEFKKLVLGGGSVNNLIEEGKLPGLSPLSFLIKNHKGEIALPYIEDRRQRFELSLGDCKLEECLKYCKEEKDHSMYKRLSLVALEKCNFEIAEECLINLGDWHELFMLYALTGKEEKMNELFDKADEQTKKEIKLYQEDVSFFFPNHQDEDLSVSDEKEDGKRKGDVSGEEMVSNDEVVLSKELDEKVSLNKKLDVKEVALYKEVVSDEDLNVPFYDSEEDKVNDMGFSDTALDKKQSLDEKFEFVNNEDIFEDLKNSSSDKETNYSTLNNESVDTKIYSSSEEDYAI